jgi:hypothetical protein
MSNDAAEAIAAFKKAEDALDQDYREGVAGPEDDLAVGKYLDASRALVQEYFPDFNPTDPRTVDCPAKLWAWITVGILRTSGLVRAVAKPKLRRQQLNKDLRTAYRKMIDLGIPGVPPRPYQRFTEEEAEHELLAIARKLERPDWNSEPTTCGEVSQALVEALKRAVVTAQAPPESSHKGKRGRKPAPGAGKRRDLVADWRQFKDGRHGAKKDFCKDRGISVRTLDAAISAERAARNRSAHE